MEEKFYEQARKNVLQWKRRKLKEEIEHEASCLKYNSEKLILTAEVDAEIERLKERMESLPIRCRWDDFARNGYRSAIREIRKERKYHPHQLRWLRSEERFRR